MVDIEDFLSPDRLLLAFPASSKRQLFQDLAALASAATKVEPAVILAAIEQRERLGTTGIGESIRGDRSGVARRVAAARA